MVDYSTAVSVDLAPMDEPIVLEGIGVFCALGRIEGESPFP